MSVCIPLVSVDNTDRTHWDAIETHIGSPGAAVQYHAKTLYNIFSLDLGFGNTFQDNCQAYHIFGISATDVANQKVQRLLYGSDQSRRRPEHKVLWVVDRKVV
ncbi:hypothetical protein HG531_010967 [Fusarium graminearum]|nr:hypothetical protein HG531_010967 [Fusarium graminearum]